MTAHSHKASSAIDAVILWVDGEDPAHRAKREAWQHGRRIPSNAGSATRFAHDGEIYICLASLRKFAPWLRRIWIVTDAQRPAMLDDFKTGDGPDIRVVDHTHIFRDHLHHLPTFNSLSIETMMWNIDGLAERFIYLNDDCFLIAPVTPDTFFDGQRPVVRGERRLTELSALKNMFVRIIARLRPGRPLAPKKHRASQDLAAWAAGLRTHYFRVKHVPHPMRRSVQAAFYRDRPKLLARQNSHRFRHLDQFVPWSLAYHLEVKSGNAMLHPPERPFSPRPDSPDLSELDRAETRFGCAQSMDEWPNDLRRAFLTRMIEKLGDALPPRVRDVLSD